MHSSQPRLFGAGVARAFGADPAMLAADGGGSVGCPSLTLPHPSGVSHWWNDARNRRAADRAGELLRPPRLAALLALPAASALRRRRRRPGTPAAASTGWTARPAPGDGGVVRGRDRVGL
eukprot:gene57411-biopygen92575